MNKPNRPQIEETIAVTARLDGGPAAYSFELTPEEFAAIGTLTVQWAFLETVLALKTVTLAKEANVPIPEDIRSFSFARRLRAFRKLADQAVKNPDQLKLYHTQVARIARLAGQRQRVAHHMWFYNPRAPEKIWSVSVRDPEARTEPFDSEKLHALAHQMGEVAYVLLNPEKPNPTPLEVLVESAEQDGTYAYVSRDFLIRARAAKN